MKIIILALIGILVCLSGCSSAEDKYNDKLLTQAEKTKQLLEKCIDLRQPSACVNGKQEMIRLTTMMKNSESYSVRDDVMDVMQDVSALGGHAF